MGKVITVQEAIEKIQNGSTVATGGFAGCMHPEALSIAVEKSFVETGKPNDLTLMYAAGQGDAKELGLNHWGHAGLIKRVVGGHWGLAPKLQKLALAGKCEGYNLPQGVVTHMFRDIAAKKPATITHIGLHTFVDPRLEGGKINEITKEDLVSLIEVYGKEYLAYKTFPIDVTLVRGTYADEAGNVTIEKECVELEVVPMCEAAKNSGGIVIVQVEKVVQNGALDARLVKIPGIFVDYIVPVAQEEHKQTFGTQYNPALSGEKRVPVASIKALPMDERKVIARRCCMELIPNAVSNLGIGMPEGMSLVAAEEGISGMLLTIESGPIGGVPAGGKDFGAAINPDCILPQPILFDFYDGGGLDQAFLGLAQCDKAGNINVSRFGPKLPGCGGFINITQTAKKLYYCGTFTAGGLELSIENGKLTVVKEGKTKKFVEKLGQVTFSGAYAAEKGQPVLYITERAVFELTADGLVLTEIAPGVDLEKDVIGQMEFRPIISKDLKLMDARLFLPEVMGLAND